MKDPMDETAAARAVPLDATGDNPGASDDPPGTGALLLEELIEDAQEWNATNPGWCEFSDIHDTCPAGVGPGAVRVTGHKPRQLFLLIAVPLAPDDPDLDDIPKLLARLMPEPEKITREGLDGLRCLCGNTPDADGFYPCLPDGTQVEPDADGPWDGLHWCAQCGRIIDQDTLEVRGRSEPPAITGPDQ